VQQDVQKRSEHSIELWYDPSFAARKWTVRCKTCGFVACCETEQEAVHAREAHRERKQIQTTETVARESGNA
jgi:hypothetical protein